MALAGVAVAQESATNSAVSTTQAREIARGYLQARYPNIEPSRLILVGGPSVSAQSAAEFFVAFTDSAAGERYHYKVSDPTQSGGVAGTVYTVWYYVRLTRTGQLIEITEKRLSDEETRRALQEAKTTAFLGFADGPELKLPRSIYDGSNPFDEIGDLGALTNRWQQPASPSP